MSVCLNGWNPISSKMKSFFFIHPKFTDWARADWARAGTTRADWARTGHGHGWTGHGRVGHDRIVSEHHGYPLVYVEAWRLDWKGIDKKGIEMLSHGWEGFFFISFIGYKEKYNFVKIMLYVGNMVEHFKNMVIKKKSS